MPRSTEEKAADEVFEQAIKDYLDVYGANSGMLMEWVLITSQHLAFDDSTSASGIGHFIPEDQPIHRTLGLIDFDQIRLRAQVAGNIDLEIATDGDD